MRTANAVTAHFLQYLQLALDSADINCRPKTPQIMMHTYTIDLQPFSIQNKPFLYIKTEGTDTGIRTVVIQYFTGCLINKDTVHLIYIRSVHAPKIRVLHYNFLFYLVRTGRYHLQFRCNLTHNIPFCIHQP